MQAFHRNFTSAQVYDLPIRNLLSATLHLVLLACSNSHIGVGPFYSIVSTIVIVMMMSREYMLDWLAFKSEGFLEFDNWVSFCCVDVNSLRNIISVYIVAKIVL